MAAPDSFFGSAIYRFFNQPQNAGAAGYERTKEERRDYLRESHEAAFYQCVGLRVACKLKTGSAPAAIMMHRAMPDGVGCLRGWNAG